MDYLNVKFFFVGVCFILYIGGTASGPPSFSGMPPSVLSFNETNKNITLLTFIVTDEGTVTIEPNNADTRNFVLAMQQITNSQSAPLKEYNVTVRNIKPLDRDQGTGGQNLHIISIKITDSEGNTVVTNPVYISVDDVNDNPPQFRNLPYRWDIDEEPFNSSAVYAIISATDFDSGENARLSYSMKPNTRSPSAENEYKKHFNITPDTGVVHLLQQLDYEENSYYQFTVRVHDHGNPPQNATADLIIRVNDVQDTPPFFTAHLNRTNIDENVPMNTSVIRVHACDGDLGVSNEVSYSILPDGGCSKQFYIYEDGWIRTNASLDRDTNVILEENGECALTVEVNEIGQNITQKYGATTANTSVTITINDLDDNCPRFNQSMYYGEINENSGEGVLIIILGGIYVSDADQGLNARMNISLTFGDGSPCKTFTADPSVVSKDGEIGIKVTNEKNDTLLNYEQTKYFELLVTVRESINATASHSANVKVTVLDVNDNVPQFLNGSYEFSIHENALNGTTLGHATATDNDKNGAETLTYSLLGGQWFAINSSSGVIYTACLPDFLDRERQDTFYMTLTVTDIVDHRSTSSLVVKLIDENDNSPIFSQHVYEVRLNENERYINPIVHVTATDDDLIGSTNSLLYYNITPKSDTNFYNNVTINESTGELFLRQPVDYEAINRKLNGIINITIMAFDKGLPPLNDTTIVRLSVQDINDCAPVFNQTVYSGETFENETSTLDNEFRVAHVRATDGDGTDRNREINYFIVSGSAGKFRVDPLSGVVSIQVDAELDFELTKYYNITIIAIDQGSPPLNSTTVVNITVKNVNDVGPTFQPKSCSIKMYENATQGPFNIDCNATDPDIDSNLTYSVVVSRAVDQNGHAVNTSLIKDWFSINKTNGAISSKQFADREVAKTVELEIIVEDVNAVKNGSQIDTAVCNVSIEDINDSYPEFRESYYKGSVSENAANGTHVLTVTADDRDENKTITFSLHPPDSPFQINKYNGVITKEGNIDCRKTTCIWLMVEARDYGNRSSFVHANITCDTDVKVTNQYAIVFDFMKVNVSESAAIGSRVINVHATSLTGDNGPVTYRLLSGNENNRFAIDRLSGEVTISTPLDRESVSSYRFAIEASNNQGSSGQVLLHVSVLDANDNAPVFSQKDYGEHRVLETDAIGTKILPVTATDIDEGVNKELTYTLEGAAGLFGISKNGTLTVSYDLRDKVGLYNITVKATDNGVPALTGTAMVHIRVVEDVNLNNPIIGHLPEGLKIKVFDCEPVDSIVWVFNYTDNDQGVNAQATFTTVEFPDPVTVNNNTFRITPDGNLVLKEPLHSIKQRVYKFIVLVTDHGLPVPLSGDVPLTIEVIGVHSRLPSFASPWSSMHLRENSVFATVDHANATAGDVDSTSCYSINEIAVSNWTRYFSLNKHTGEITNIIPVDYEMVKTITLSIHVDDCSVYTNATCAYNRTQGQHTRISDVNVTITVDDVNDNPPVFVNHSIFVEIIHGLRPGSVLDLQLKNETYVHDRDSRRNGLDVWTFGNDGHVIVSPSFKGQIIPDSGMALCQDNFKHPFCVTSNGTIVANIVIDESMSGFVYVPIKVKDTAGEDTANVTIFFIGNSYLASMVVRQSLTNVTLIKDELMRLYSNLTGYQFVFDKLRNHVKPNGVIVTSRSDLDYHVVYPVDGHMLSVEEIRRLLESIMDDRRYIDILNVYHIEISIQQI